MEGVGAGLLVLVCALVCILVVYQEACSRREAGVHEDLRRLAQLAATVVDVDLHETIRDPSQQSSPEFKAAVEPLRRILKNCKGVKFVYTAILKDDKIFFIVDSADSGDADGDGRDDQAKVMEEYTDADPAAFTALREGVCITTPEPYTDEWGTFLTGFAPFRNSKGAVAGVVGVDITVTDFLQRIGAMQTAAWVACIPAVLAAVMTGIVQFFRCRTTRYSIIEMAMARQQLENQAAALTVTQARLDQRNASLQSYVDEVVATNAALETREQALEIQNKELAALHKENVLQKQRIEVAIVAAEAANRAKSEFLANMSHEIRTPMTAILGFTQIMVERVVDPADREQLQVILRNGEHLLRLINDILDLSKIEANRITIERLSVCPAQLVADVVSLMRVRSDAKGLPLVVEYASRIPRTISTDPTRLRQILVNLIGNAIKFTEKGDVRMVVAFLESSGGSLMQFDVLDTGIGMSETQVAALFRPFSQADSSLSRRFGGTGLGLTISKKFAELLGGDVALHSSRPGDGTCFRATIATGAVASSDLVEANVLSATMSAPSEPQPTAASYRLSARILLAEDGTDNQKLIAFILRKAGAEVAIVENGQLAFDEVMSACKSGHPYDVVLMDMQMPVLDGYQATTQLRQSGYIGPIIALTAHAMSEDRDKCLAAGCDDYATKPINKNELFATIGRNLGRQHAAPSTAEKQGSDGSLSNSAETGFVPLRVLDECSDLMQVLEKDFNSEVRTTLQQAVRGITAQISHPCSPVLVRMAAQLDDAVSGTLDVQGLIAQLRQLKDLMKSHMPSPATCDTSKLEENRISLAQRPQ